MQRCKDVGPGGRIDYGRSRLYFLFQAEDGIRDLTVTGVQTCALPISSPPLLTTLHLDGKDVPVVIQGNKSGLLYVLNRDTGKPVFPVEERLVPKSDVPGEAASPTHPFPVKTPPPVPHTFSPDPAWCPTSQDRDWFR